MEIPWRMLVDRWVHALDTLGVGMIEASLDGQVTWANQAAHEISGGHPEALLLQALVEGGTDRSLKDALTQLASAPPARRMRTRPFVRPDGAVRWVDLDVALWRDAPAGVRVVAFDLGTAHRGGAALRREEERLDALVTLGIASDSLDERGFLRLALEEAVRLTGSEIGYLHFVNDDQVSLSLGMWSSATYLHCTAVKDDHYPLTSAGIGRTRRASGGSSFTTTTPPRPVGRAFPTDTSRSTGT